MPLRTFAIVLSQVHLPPRWAKHWGFARRIQDCNQCKLQKMSNPDSFRKEFALMRIPLFQKMRGWLRARPRSKQDKCPVSDMVDLYQSWFPTEGTACTITEITSD